ncbi:beta-glucoside-specific PTS transporter subunit IIABC [Amphibacillus sediminis]|uniref:beta-glucoside-specific PTS transporter subunit IIABC n=1 Tax=Amphibacillus sediminis TaxID=360185 RepID=UPI00082A314A|nr:beta-glucoside-specific PTS transporter subunit IIABC [Amphibacillus sediminis]
MAYQELVKEVLENIGGKENINGVTHCITRLRFKLKDESKANTDKIKQIKGVVTVVQSGGQYQVVIGNHVPEVYQELVKIAGIQSNSPNEETSEKKGILNTFIDVISGIFTPVISVLMASGMIKGLNALLVAFGVIESGSGTNVILQATGDSLFYFFPLFLGYTAAKKFGAKPFIGMAIGGALVYPAVAAATANLEPLYSLFPGTIFESPVYLTFAGIPVILMTYSSSVIPIILAVFCAAKLERVLNSIIPKEVRGFFIPFFTLLITVPLTYIVIGPLATWAGLLLGNVMLGVYNFSPIIAGIIIGGFWQVFIMFGLHWGFIPIALNNIATIGYDTIMIAGSATPLATAGVVLGIFLKTRNKKLKEISFPAFLSAVFGITEPALYGVTLPRKKTFFATLASVAVAGGIMGIFGSKSYVAGATGVFAIPNFINPEAGIDKGFIGYVIAVSIAFIMGLVLSLTFAYDPKVDEEPENNEPKQDPKPALNESLGKTVYHELASPIQGEVVPLDQIEDEAFSAGLLGKGVALVPQKGQVVAPEDGVVTTLFPTKHAIGLTTDSGVEVLIHIGMDTVNLKGQFFEAHVQQGDHVKKGQLLVTFELEKIKDAGYPLITPVVISNTAEYLDVMATKKQTIMESEPLLTVIS